VRDRVSLQQSLAERHPVPDPNGRFRINKVGPVVDNGEAWLDHLGIPSKALSQAIERVPTKGPDNLEDD
jgi:hypothetical protein